MEKRKILVTGGTGYIGSHTVVELILSGYTVEILDNLYNSDGKSLDGIEQITGVRPKLHIVDLLDFEATNEVLAEGGFETVMHFAGLKVVTESVEQPLRYYENNIMGTINLLKAMRRNNVKKLVFSSSASVYGEKDVAEMREDMEVGQKIFCPYGRTKYMIEQILLDEVAADDGLEVAILRYFNPVGAHPSGLIGENPKESPGNLMYVVMRVARGELKTLKIFGTDYETRDGTAIRDFIHVVDLAKGHIAVLKKMRPGALIYNLGTGTGTTVKELIKAFEKASGQTLPVEYAERRSGDLPAVYANADKANEELGWKAELSIDEAMKDTINYLRKNS